MLSEQEQKRHAVDLEYLKNTLENTGLDAELYEASEEQPISYLAGYLPDPNNEPSAAYQLLYIPGDHFEEVALLQIHIYMLQPLPANVDKAQSLMPYINTASLLGYFGLEEDGQLFYRYVYALPRFDPPNEAVFLETFSLCINNFASLMQLVLQVGMGEKQPEEVKAQLLGG